MLAATQLLPTKRKRDISLTALIDVVFILLMFFMLTSSFIQQKMVTINTPGIAKHAGETQPQLLVLHNDKSLTFFNDERHRLNNWEELPALINQQEPLILLPEQRVSLANIVGAMENITQQGVTTLTLGKSVEVSSTP